MSFLEIDEADNMPFFAYPAAVGVGDDLEPDPPPAAATAGRIVARTRERRTLKSMVRVPSHFIDLDAGQADAADRCAGFEAGKRFEELLVRATCRPQRQDRSRPSGAVAIATSTIASCHPPGF